MVGHGCVVTDTSVDAAQAEHEHAIDALARYFTDSSQVLPGISVDDSSRARSWWWPLPSTQDRSAIAAMCADGSVEAQRAVAERLSVAVDRMTRDRLVARGVELTARRAGRRTIEDSWLLSLTAADPWLARSIGIDKLRAFEREIARWVESGAATMGSILLCLQVREPIGAADQWSEVSSPARSMMSMMSMMSFIVAASGPTRTYPLSSSTIA